MLEHFLPAAPIGLGAAGFRLAVYIANRPNNPEYTTLNNLRPLAKAELGYLVANNSNHWRKVLNVYAKFLWALDWPAKTGVKATSWQQYRDDHLLQAHSAEALLFGVPQFDDAGGLVVHVVAGKTYAAQLQLQGLTWVDAHFAIDAGRRVIVTPYFDYRQLSNARINTLVDLIGGWI